MSATSKSLFCAMGLFSAVAAPARAEEHAVPPPKADAENGRFSMTPVAGGFLRLDTRTGQTSLCSVTGDQAQCRASADERTALEAEISRLAKENAALKAQGAMPAQNSAPVQDEEDRRFNRAMDRAETFVRRMLRLFHETEKPANPPL